MGGGLWHCTRGRNQDHPQEKEIQKSKWLSEEALQEAEKRREVKGKEIEENNKMGNTRDLFKKIRDIKGRFHEKMGTIKDRNDMDGSSWHCTGGSDQDHPQEKEIQKAKWLSEEAL